MCPAPSTTTSASGRLPASSTAVAGGVTRSCSPTITSAGTRRAGARVAGPSPSARRARRSTPRRRAPGELHDVVDQVAGRLGAELREPRDDPPTSAGLASTACGGGPRVGGLANDPNRGRKSSATEPIAPRNRSEDDAPIEHEAGDRVPNSSGRCSAIARIAMAPMLCPTTTAGRSGATASSTAAMSRPIARSDRSPWARRRSVRATDGPSARSGSRSTRSIHCSCQIVMSRLNPCDEQQHRARRDRRRPGRRSPCRRRTRWARGRRAAGRRSVRLRGRDALRRRRRPTAPAATTARRDPPPRSAPCASWSSPPRDIAAGRAGADAGHDLVPIVPAAIRQLLRRDARRPVRPAATTSSPGSAPTSPQSTISWSIVTLPATRHRRPPIRTSAATTGREGSRRRSPPARSRSTRRAPARSGGRSETVRRRRSRFADRDRGAPRERGPEIQVVADARRGLHAVEPMPVRTRSSCASG